MKRPTLRGRLIRSFLLILTPLAVFLYFENYYAVKVVHEEVSKSTSGALSIHIDQIDRTLEDVTHYLLRQIVTPDLDSGYLAMTLNSEESGGYILAKIKIHDELVSGSGSFENLHTFFAYSAEKDDFIFSRASYVQTTKLKAALEQHLNSRKPSSKIEWEVLRQDKESYLLQVVQAHGIYVGAVIRLEDLIDPLRKLVYGERWEAILLDAQGQPLTASSMPPETMSAVNQKLLAKPVAYQVFKNQADDKRYLLVSTHFSQAPLSLAAMIQEKSLLQQLPFFQSVLYLIPLGVVIVVFFYSHFLRKMLFSPLNALSLAMRRVMQGQLDTGVKEMETEELNFLSQTFNHMVSRISHLKINVYEEMLKAQQSEFKHLQAQINPHFYLNSLNIINSLATLGETELVKKMTEHLADYFRFITRSHRDQIMLDEELQHIVNYLEIQSVRFPDKLTYRIDVQEPLGRSLVLPLMLQPFVENAVIHGMREGSAPFHIDINVRTLDDLQRYAVTIRDNGRGFTPEALARYRQLDFGDGTGRHMGVWNVYRRIRMVFGDQAELSFDNMPPHGARVQLILPIRGESRLEEEDHA